MNILQTVLNDHLHLLVLFKFKTALGNFANGRIQFNDFPGELSKKKSIEILLQKKFVQDVMGPKQPLIEQRMQTRETLKNL